MKSGKSRKTCLTNHTQSISHHWLLMPLGAGTHTYAHIPMYKTKQFQETRHAPAVNILYALLCIS